MLLLKKLRFEWIMLVLVAGITGAYAQSNYDIKSSTSKLCFDYTQTPDALVSQNSSFDAGATFQWQQSSEPTAGFTDIAGATSAGLSFTAVFTQTTFYRRLATKAGATTTSNVLKVELVSKFWENENYMRVHSILVPAQTDWQVIDQLPTGDKLVSTTYMDGVGRPVQKLIKEVATPAAGSSTWGDAVQFSLYDNYGREQKQYLGYTTTAEPGKMKSSPATAQALYYSNKYQDSHPYSLPQYDESPLNRVLNVKMPGDAWHQAAGNSAALSLNYATDNIPILTIGYGITDKPVSNGIYTDKTLIKGISTDELGKKVISFTNNFGQPVFKAVQLDNNATQGGSWNGWICTAYVYDDFGHLRCEIPAEAVKWLATHSWNFSATNGQTVFDEQCFVYHYDDKGRTVRKKSPGVKALSMIYDSRDRVVFMQDGNQSLKTPAEWTANIYDDLDRIVLTTLYRSDKSRDDLQGMIDGATTTTTTIIDNPGALAENLLVDHYDPAATRYAASNTVTIDEGFDSPLDAQYSIEIDPTAVAPTITVTTTTHHNPIFSELGGSNCTILKYLFYDDYSFNGTRPFDGYAAAAAAQYPAGAGVLAIAATARTTGMPTGSLTRVLGTAQFLSTTLYYDEDGQPIQSIDQNIKQAYDVATSQYGWDGRLLATHSRHAMPGTNMDGYAIKTKYLFDKIGRVTSTQKQFGSNAVKTIAAYRYDDMGRVQTKTLDPDYTHPVAGMGPAGGGLETIDYSYNVQGSLTGMNKDYALKGAGYSKWQHFFGMFIGYDNTGGVLNDIRLNGQMSGQVWTTMGDDNRRKYDYTYDNAGRLSNAVFAETPASGVAALDFSTSSYTGKIEYDLNGNLQAMTNKGNLLGSMAVQTIDDLRYTYDNFSNRLLKVTDQSPLAGLPANGANGDFKDGGNGSTNDYVYDENGNLVADLNKDIKNLAGASGIRYNHLDKPEEIKIDGKGTIRITYDADGSKLRRSFTSTTTGATKTTTYINEFVYEETTGGSTPHPGSILEGLQFISFEEGRIRPVTPRADDNGLDALTLNGNMNLPDGKEGSIDYFITDQRHDTRMILTEETQWSRATASMETADNRGGVEEGLFGQTGSGNEVAASRVAKTTAPGWVSNTSSYISQLNSTRKTGPNQLLKVMAGDQLSSTVQYYYQQDVTSAGGSNITSSVLSLLAGAISGSPAVGAGGHNAAADISSNLGSSAAFTDFLTSDPSNATSTKPKAYLNIIFLDERFNFVAEGSTSQRVDQPGDNAPPLAFLHIKAPKNGYCYIYISNESNENVFFDNLQIRHDRARILEENHYYAYGLKIAAISSKAYGAPNNNYGYQGDFNEFDDDLGWNDFALRSYDPQIGRFLQNDPYDQFASGYTGMGNDPTNGIDPSGGYSGQGLDRALVGAASGFAVGVSAAVLSGNGDQALKWGAIGALGGAAIGNFSLIVGSLRSVAPTLAVNAANILTGGFNQNHNGTNGPAISNSPYDVSMDGRVVGQIKSTYWQGTTGVNIDLAFDNTSSALTGFDWIQTVISNSANKSSPFIDINERVQDSHNPFYHTDRDIIYNKNKYTYLERAYGTPTGPGHAAAFFDSPSRTKNGFTQTFTAELSLVGKDANGKHFRMITFKYGFSMDASGHITPLALTVTTEVSAFHSSAIKKADIWHKIIAFFKNIFGIDNVRLK